jgi:hypothetical protein
MRKNPVYFTVYMVIVQSLGYDWVHCRMVIVI